MSHPDPTRTYAEDLLTRWSNDELDRLWELFVEGCKQSEVYPSMSDFMIFLEERV